MRTSYIDFEHACRVADEYKTANERNMEERFKLEQDLKQAREEIEVLKAKLKKARHMFNIDALSFDVNEYDKRLNSITLESLKGE